MLPSVDLGLALLSVETSHRLTVDRHFRIVSGADRLAGLLEIEAPDNLLQIFSPRDHAYLRLAAEKLEDRQVTTCTLSTLPGIPVEILILPLAGGFEVVCRDITDRLQSLERLTFFYRYFLTTNIAICITDAEGKILDVNRAFLDFYGYRMESVIGKTPRILKSGRQSPSAYAELWQSITDEHVGQWTGELINRKSSGEEVTVLLSVSAVRRNRGPLFGYIASAMDISRQKWLEEELTSYNQELTDLSRLKSNLMAITSHDLKSPLNAVISRAQLVMDTCDHLPREKMLAHLEQIVLAGRKMANFIDDLLDLEKIEAGKVELSSKRLHLDRVLRSCVDLNRVTAEGKGVTIDFDAAPGLSPVSADLVKLEQIFNNLLSNAIKFSPAGTVISVGCQASPDGFMDVTITDQGPGIPAAEIEGIFDRYFQARRQGGVSKRIHGAGLGLHIVKSYVDLHKGTVWVENRPEGGCRFVVRLPMVHTVQSGQDLAALIIDPAQQIFHTFEKPFRSEGVSCYIARTPEDADQIVQYEAPQIVIFDPDALDDAWHPLLGRLRSAHKQESPFLVHVQKEMQSSSDNDCDFSMVTPVIDLEIFDMLREAKQQLSRGELS